MAGYGNILGAISNNENQAAANLNRAAEAQMQTHLKGQQQISDSITKGAELIASNYHKNQDRQQADEQNKRGHWDDYSMRTISSIADSKYKNDPDAYQKALKDFNDNQDMYKGEFNKLMNFKETPDNRSVFSRMKEKAQRLWKSQDEIKAQQAAAPQNTKGDMQGRADRIAPLNQQDDGSMAAKTNAPASNFNKEFNSGKSIFSLEQKQAMAQSQKDFGFEQDGVFGFGDLQKTQANLANFTPEQIQSYKRMADSLQIPYNKNSKMPQYEIHKGLILKHAQDNEARKTGKTYQNTLTK